MMGNHPAREHQLARLTPFTVESGIKAYCLVGLRKSALKLSLHSLLLKILVELIVVLEVVIQVISCE